MPTVSAAAPFASSSEDSKSGCTDEYNNGQIRNGLSNCVYILKDINEGDGGVGFVPGSHKANYEVPPDIAHSANDGIMYPVVNPTAKAGDLIVRPTPPSGSAHARRLTPPFGRQIFTEATLHCTLPWTNPDHETRRLLYRYSPKYLHMDGGTFETTQPEWVSELTETQRAVLEPPYSYARPEVSNDGQRVLPIKQGATPDGRLGSSGGAAQQGARLEEQSKAEEEVEEEADEEP